MEEEAILRQAAAIARAHRDPAKLAEHARAIGEAQRGIPKSEEHKTKLREAQAARRERERQERAALGLDAAPASEKKSVGRPKTRPDVPAGEKRSVGRPKKQAEPNTALAIDTPEKANRGHCGQEGTGNMKSMDYEEFAEAVRRKALRLMTVAGSDERGLQLGAMAAEICTMAAQAKTQARFQQEQENANRYDLAALPASSPFDE